MVKISDILWSAANQWLAAEPSNWRSLRTFALNAIAEAAYALHNYSAESSGARLEAQNFFRNALAGGLNYTEAQWGIFTGMEFNLAQQLRYDQLMLAYYIAVDQNL